LGTGRKAGSCPAARYNLCFAANPAGTGQREPLGGRPGRTKTKPPFFPNPKFCSYRFPARRDSRRFSGKPVAPGPEKQRQHPSVLWGSERGCPRPAHEQEAGYNVSSLSFSAVAVQETDRFLLPAGPASPVRGRSPDSCRHTRPIPNRRWRHP
jgi:hypothetical protein